MPLTYKQLVAHKPLLDELFEQHLKSFIGLSDRIPKYGGSDVYRVADDFTVARVVTHVYEYFKGHAEIRILVFLVKENGLIEPLHNNGISHLKPVDIWAETLFKSIGIKDSLKRDLCAYVFSPERIGKCLEVYGWEGIENL